MNPALWIAKTGLDAQQTRMGVISNNLANVNTMGYKRGRAAFSDLIYQNLKQVGAQSSQNTQLPSGLAMGTGVQATATQKIFTQGNIAQTGNTFDLAINGRGFFQILRPDGTQAYTRDGGFQVSREGRVVTSTGYDLQPAIVVPPDAQTITVGVDGIVSAQLPGQADPATIGAIQLADFINPAGLEPIGDNQFRESGASGAPQIGTPALTGLGSLVQGALETSNVNTVEEMVNMIETQRAYEMNSKAISSADQMLQTLNQRL
ncbi:MAG: flagellar basal-body rod protein FlgG [Pseudomonadales bacterium]|jgi:flagellar basal-body rod protein FlgG